MVIKNCKEAVLKKGQPFFKTDFVKYKSHLSVAL